MLDPFDLDDITSIAAAKLRDMTRVTSAGTKVNVHVIPAKAEPKPDFEAMRILVAGPVKVSTVTKTDDSGKD